MDHHQSQPPVAVESIAMAVMHGVADANSQYASDAAQIVYDGLTSLRFGEGRGRLSDDKITPTAFLMRELGMDSLHCAELCMELERGLDGKLQSYDRAPQFSRALDLGLECLRSDTSEVNVETLAVETYHRLQDAIAVAASSSRTN